MACRDQQSRRRRRREGEGAEQEITPDSAPSRPHFCMSICFHMLESEKLGIPKGFLRRYGKDLEGSVLLKVPGGSAWPVELEKSDNDMVWLCKGWRKFMEHYSIGYGHHIVFKYEGDSIFNVIIFDMSGSEIDYPSSIKSDVSSPEGEFLSQKEESIIEIEDSDSSSQEFGGPRSLPTLELASQFKSVHPFFKLVIRPSYVQRCLKIPCEFFTKHVQKNKQIATLRYSDRSWCVKLWRHEPLARVFLTTGWSSFARETGLRVQDVCVFELVDRDNIVFTVSIFSSNGRIHSSPCLSPVTAHEKARKFESQYPFFNIVMCRSYLNGNNVTIPWQFIKAHIQGNRRMATLVYLGQSFEVKLQVYRCSSNSSLGTGWSAFTREASLHKGDVCVFELVDRDNIVFRVSIFRGADKKEICVD